MGKAYVSKFGDWTRAGTVLQALSVNLCPTFKAQLSEDGELLLDEVRGHILNQDLDWEPLSPHTIALKGGDDTIYVEKGYLYSNLEVRKIKAPKDGVTLFVGASAWKRTPDGLKFSDLMIWLEYGTDKMPPRPLIRPSWEKVRPILEDNWDKLLKEFVDAGGSYNAR